MKWLSNAPDSQWVNSSCGDMKVGKNFVLIACASALAFCAASAHAAPVLVNGNFESGTTGWTSYTTSSNGTISLTPSMFGAPQPQNAAVKSFNVTGSGASSALALNAGKIASGFGQQPGEGGGVFQTFSTTGGLATFSADIAALWTNSSGGSGIGLLSVLIDDAVMDSYDFGAVPGGLATYRSTLDFTTSLSAGTHTIKLQSTRLFAPGGNEASPIARQFFDNVSLDVAPVPEPSSWALMVGGIGLMGGMLRSRRRVAARFA
jgi:hypothetical protein